MLAILTLIIFVAVGARKNAPVAIIMSSTNVLQRQKQIDPRRKPKSGRSKGAAPSDEVGGIASARARNPCKTSVEKKVGLSRIVQTPSTHVASHRT